MTDQLNDGSGLASAWRAMENRNVLCSKCERNGLALRTVQLCVFGDKFGDRPEAGRLLAQQHAAKFCRAVAFRCPRLVQSGNLPLSTGLVGGQIEPISC